MWYIHAELNGIRSVAYRKDIKTIPSLSLFVVRFSRPSLSLLQIIFRALSLPLEREREIWTLREKTCHLENGYDQI